MSEQERLMRQISAYKFSAWELHMFLDTHPNNCEAAKRLKEAQKKAAELTEKYESQFGPINETSRDTAVGLGLQALGHGKWRRMNNVDI